MYILYIYVSRPRKGNYTATPQGFVYSFVSRDTSCTHKTPQLPEGPTREGYLASSIKSRAYCHRDEQSALNKKTAINIKIIL